MTKARPYISLAIVLLILATPWLLPPEVKASAEDQYCECCQGPCHGCCCSHRAKDEATDSDAGCPCAVTEQPMDLQIPDDLEAPRPQQQEVQLNDEVESVLSVDMPQDDCQPVVCGPPTSILSCPTYILNSTFLI